MDPTINVPVPQNRVALGTYMYNNPDYLRVQGLCTERMGTVQCMTC
jgi:hypothetical protein